MVAILGGEFKKHRKVRASHLTAQNFCGLTQNLIVKISSLYNIFLAIATHFKKIEKKDTGSPLCLILFHMVVVLNKG